MIAIKLSAVVGKDRKLVLDLPEETPTGMVEVIIQSPLPTPRTVSNPAREAARAKLAAARLLSTTHHLPDGTLIPTDTEVLAAGQLPPGSRPSEALISEDRDE